MKTLKTNLIISLITLVTLFYASFASAADSAALGNYIACPNVSSDAELIQCVTSKTQDELKAQDISSTTAVCNSMGDPSPNAQFTAVHNGNSLPSVSCKDANGLETNNKAAKFYYCGNINKGFTKSPRFASGQQCNFCPANSIIDSNGYCQSNNPEQTCIDSGKWWDIQNLTCEVKPTCSSSEVYNAQTNSCDPNPASCINQNLSNKYLSYKRTNDGTVSPFVEIPFSEYEYLASDGCVYNFVIPADIQQCWTYPTTSDKSGYCSALYQPTYQDATNQAQEYQGVPNTPESCPNGTLNDFGSCITDITVSCDSNTEWHNTVNNTCEPKAQCAADAVYLPEVNGCDNSCPVGQSRPDSSSPCQQVLDDVCQDGFNCVNGVEFMDKCPSGTYRTGLKGSCVPVPSNRIESACINPEQVEWPNTKYCFDPEPVPPYSYTSPTSGVVYENLQITCSTGTANQTLGICEGQTQTPNSIACKNVNQTNSSPLTYGYHISRCGISSSKLRACENPNHILRDDGSCFPNGLDCIANPENPLCEGAVSDGGSTDNTRLEDLLEGTASIEGHDEKLQSVFDDYDSTFGNEFEKDSNGDPVIDSEYLSAFNGFMENSGIKTLYDGYLELNPFTELSTASCSYSLTLNGETRLLDMCDDQADLHAVISFMLFIYLMFSLRDLIFERPS